MAAERPVICSDGAGASELIRSGENGFVYPAQDTAQCAATIQQALAHNSDESRKIGQAARATVLSELAANRVAHARAQRYSAIAAAGRSVGKKHPWRSLGFRRPGKSADPNDLLGGLALRRIAKYGLARAARKCRGKS
jgi:glycosyltransferase involved in cell wall biosynthesis